MTLNFYTDMTKTDDINEAQLLAEIHEKGALVDSNAQVLPTNPIEPVNIESAESWDRFIPKDKIDAIHKFIPKDKIDAIHKAETVEDTCKKIDYTVNNTSVNWLLALIAVLLLLILIFK